MKSTSNGRLKGTGERKGEEKSNTKAVDMLNACMYSTYFLRELYPVCCVHDGANHSF
jgi:hypothetical protein